MQLMLGSVDELRRAGCALCAVNLAQDDPDVVWVTEIWTSPEARRGCLELPRLKRVFAEAAALLAGEPSEVALSVVGGLGLPEPPPPRQDDAGTSRAAHGVWLY